MTYKIFILEVDDPIKPLYSPLIIKTIGTNRSITFEEFQTEYKEELQDKIAELIQTKGTTKFRTVIDITPEVVVIVPEICVHIPEEPEEPETPEEPTEPIEPEELPEEPPEELDEGETEPTP